MIFDATLKAAVGLFVTKSKSMKLKKYLDKYGQIVGHYLTQYQTSVLSTFSSIQIELNQKRYAGEIRCSSTFLAGRILVLSSMVRWRPKDGWIIEFDVKNVPGL